MHKNSIEGFYTKILLFFGMLYIFIVPPFQMADEDSHFKKAYLVSNFELLPKVIDGQYGNFLPTSIIEFENDHRYMIGDISTKYNYSKLYYNFAIPKDYSEKEFVTYHTSKTHPLLYIPQAAGIIAFKILFFFNESFITPGTILYAGRIGNLLFYSICFYWALKLMPFYKRVTVLIGLMPMTLGLASSLSYDAMVIGISLLLVAYILRLAYTADSIRLKDIIVLCIFSITLIEMKMVYFPLLGMYFLIPKTKFESTKAYIKNFAFIISSGILGHIVWSLISSFGLAAAGDSANYISDQVKFILNNPFSYLGIVFHSTIANFKFYAISFVGNLGWLDTNFPYIFIIAYLLLLLVTSLYDSNAIKISTINKVIILFVFVSVVLLIETSLYLIWTAIPTIGGIGHPIILGVQGRYFIPCALLFLMLLSNTSLIGKKWGLKTSALLDSSIPTFATFSCTLMMLILLLRYWVPEI